MRSRHRAPGFALWLTILAACVTHCSSTSKTEKAPACAPGKTQACIGLRGCDGAQTCKPDGTGFTNCECIDGTGGSAGLGGASGSGGAGATSGVGAASGTNGAAGSAGTSGASGSGGTNGSSGTGGANGNSGEGGSAGSAGAADASPGCTQECFNNITACAAGPAQQCMCNRCGCEVTTCLANSACLQVALCVVQSCTTYSDCIGATGPCGSQFNMLPSNVRSMAIALGGCLQNYACPTCN